MAALSAITARGDCVDSEAAAVGLAVERALQRMAERIAEEVRGIGEVAAPELPKPTPRILEEHPTGRVSVDIARQERCITQLSRSAYLLARIKVCILGNIAEVAVALD